MSLKNNKISSVILLWLLNSISTVWSLNESAIFDTPLGKELLMRSKTADIKAWMDLNVEPCDNFYNFACGKWHRINAAQLFGDYTTDRFQDMSKSIQHKVHKLLRAEKTGDVIEDKLRDFYESCRAIEANDTAYMDAMRKVYQEFGEFSFLKPIDNGTDSVKEFNWWSTVANIIRIYGKSIIFSVDILDDVKSKNKTMVYVGPPEFSMTQAAINIIHSFQEARIQIYLNKYLGAPKEIAKQLARAMMTFETSLTIGATDAREGKTIEEMLTLYNVTDLQQEFGDLLDFEEFLKLALNTTELPQQVYLYDQSYFQNILHVLNVTDSSIVENYILWLLLEEYFIHGKEDEPEKWCAEKAKTYFGKFIDHAIYKQYRSEKYEQEMFELWHEIKATFRDDLRGDKYYWMSNGTREYAIKKLDKMSLTINSYELENFEIFFKNLQINASNYVGNIAMILKHGESLRVNKLEKKPDGIEDAQTLSFTPVYNSFENAIKIPVALLQPYLVWHPLYPKAIKYATLGFLLAHEMIHGFDDDGRNYDAAGNSQSWWDEKSSYEFESRRRCFQAQYHNYTYAGKRLPESVSQPENIADNAAVKIAYISYVRWLENQKQNNNSDIETQETLVNLPYNNRELFFISYAQMWCEDVQSLFRTLLAHSDIHAPSKYRVIGTLSNFHDFSWIFKCDMKPGTPMNPSIKCELY